MLADFVEALIGSINSTSAADVPSLSQAIHERRCRSHARTAFESYQAAMSTHYEAAELKTAEQVGPDNAAIKPLFSQFTTREFNSLELKKKNKNA